MKRILVIFCLTAMFSFLKGQITMQTNLPKAIPLNSDITFEVKINKGSHTNFAKYQMEIPRGIVMKEVDVKSGSFTFEDNVVKIIWVMAPVESEFTISMKLISGVMPGKKSFVQKYFYVENDDKREIEMEPVMVAFKDSASSAASVSTEEFYTLTPKTAPSLLTTTINAAEISTKNPELLKQQVLQLKKDSKDAYEVGEREKKKAELKLAESAEALAKAEGLKDENEKTAAIDKANNDRKKAENDLQVASRVLILAKSLDENANEIDSINRSINPLSYSGQSSVAAANTPRVTDNTQQTATALSGDDKTETESGTKKSRKKEKEKAEDAAANASETGLVYKIQLGAFSKEPSKRDFRALGKVKITEENGMYKVLYGSFTSKQDAFKEREQIISKGFDGFVVGYQDGVRIK
ncbi:hypothetical protein CNR22_22655 [Sphingobacteriaceae bacterium]|nr:hypothetical protein CNR22_22655 [Sphingobacteriaceae bacterium]